MKHCTRCGIEIPFAGMCRDCAEVEGIGFAAPEKQQRIIVKPGRGRRAVTSSRSRSVRLTPQESDEVWSRTLRNETSVEIALAVGCSSRTVTRIRAARRRG